MPGCTRRRRGRTTRVPGSHASMAASPWLRVATTSAYHVPGSQRAGASTASQRQACTHRLRATTHVGCAWQWQCQACHCHCSLHSSAAGASISSFLLQGLMSESHDLHWLHRSKASAGVAFALCSLFGIMLMASARVWNPRIRRGLALFYRLFFWRGCGRK